ncbi:glycine cleavage system protein R [Alteromonas ponticola]|uniref:Glycine cleavage system transcriptional repressor n=1 Tax=Alteromonas aquimaris TaxID=2998417 RepID=A0ABT3PBL6_9ALTE|nr:ACT domain-containing protein [Alteromonas aquimaris]MCW8109486.1 glycine cleavage system protein R [Alteromonas aquimaris]
MQSLIITVIGKDKPGIVDSIAKNVYQRNGNWLSSSFAHMAGMFTGFVEVQVSEENVDELVSSVSKIPELDVHSISVASAPTEFANTLTVDVMGNDKQGIVQELTSVFNQFNLNIISFESRCESAPAWGSLMFKARAVISVPDNFDEAALQAALENRSNDLVVDIANAN